MLKGLIVDYAECTIGGRPAISGTTSRDSNGNLILNLYTN